MRRPEKDTRARETQRTDLVLTHRLQLVRQGPKPKRRCVKSVTDSELGAELNFLSLPRAVKSAPSSPCSRPRVMPPGARATVARAG